MHDLIELTSILAAILFGAMSAGPSFVMVSRLALAGTRRDGISAAVGMGLGGALFASLALFGLISLLLQVPWLYLALKVAGGAYLLYLGFSIWRGASRPLDESHSGFSEPVQPQGRALRLAFATQVANPKTAVVYASIFASFLPENPSWLLLLVIPPAVFLVEMGWYGTVARVLSAPHPKDIYLKSKWAIDRVAGGVMGALGLRLMFTAIRDDL